MSSEDSTSCIPPGLWWLPTSSSFSTPPLLCPSLLVVGAAVSGTTLTAGHSYGHGKSLVLVRGAGGGWPRAGGAPGACSPPFPGRARGPKDERRLRSARP